MTETVQEILATFDHLPLGDQKEVTRVILRRSLDVDTPTLSDDEMVLQAEELFLELDKQEAEDAGT